MDLQTVFYTVAIIAMIIFIVLSISVIYLVFLIKKMVIETREQVVSKIVEYTKPVDVFKGLSSSIIGNLLLKLRNNFVSR
jgi:hypothetical protein